MCFINLHGTYIFNIITDDYMSVIANRQMMRKKQNKNYRFSNMADVDLFSLFNP